MKALTKIKTVTEMKEIVALLRRSGFSAIQEQDVEFALRLDIIYKCNPKRLKFAASKLPIFDGDFVKYRTACAIFFNELFAKKQAHKQDKKINKNKLGSDFEPNQTKGEIQLWVQQ